MKHRLSWSIAMAALDTGVYAPLDEYGVLTVRTCVRDDQGTPVRVSLVFTEGEEPPDAITCPVCQSPLRVPSIPWEHPAEVRSASGLN